MEIKVSALLLIRSSFGGHSLLILFSVELAPNPSIRQNRRDKACSAKPRMHLLCRQADPQRETS